MVVVAWGAAVGGTEQVMVRGKEEICYIRKGLVKQNSCLKVSIVLSYLEEVLPGLPPLQLKARSDATVCPVV